MQLHIPRSEFSLALFELVIEGIRVNPFRRFGVAGFAIPIFIRLIGLKNSDAPAVEHGELIA